jgi:hypothetical protein
LSDLRVIMKTAVGTHCHYTIIFRKDRVLRFSNVSWLIATYIYIYIYIFVLKVLRRFAYISSQNKPITIGPECVFI